jgi:mannose-6-phosphate isomerase
MQPVPLAANTPDTFYRGGSRIGRFRGRPGTVDDAHPEDWIASTTARFGSRPAETAPPPAPDPGAPALGAPGPGAPGSGAPGLSRLPDGRLLVDAVRAAPERWLGAAHVARYGADPTILVKLLDAGQRLPLHVHPDRRFARSHLASPYGKTEAWVILEAVPEAVVHLGLSRDVDARELAGWVARQDLGAMLGATNRVPVRAGDTVLVPAGLPHAIGEGVLLVEVQEATDLSVLLEIDGFSVDPSTALLGLPRDEALACVDRSGWGADRLASLRARRPAAGEAGTSRPGVEPLFPAAADEFFSAELLRPDPVSVLDPGFGVVVVTAGRGRLEPEAGAAIVVSAGDTLVVPYEAGTVTLRGAVTAIRARPAPVGS